MTVTLHEARPASLVYLDHNFHVVDLQVIFDDKILTCTVIIYFLVALPMSPDQVWDCRRGTPQH